MLATIGQITATFPLLLLLDKYCSLDYYQAMSRSWNHIELIGNLTHDPELRKTTKGTSVCGFRMATNRRWQDAQGAIQEETAYHRIIAWSTLGEQCAQLLKKGSHVFVSGRLSYREYTKDDEKRMVTEIVIDDMIMLDKRNTPATPDAALPHHTAPEPAPEDVEEEFPF